MYKKGNRVFVFVNGGQQKGTILDFQSDKYVVELLDGSRVIVDESQLSPEL